MMACQAGTRAACPAVLWRFRAHPQCQSLAEPLVPLPPAVLRAAAAAARTPTTSVAQKSELTLLCERFQQQFGHLQARAGAGGAGRMGQRGARLRTRLGRHGRMPRTLPPPLPPPPRRCLHSIGPRRRCAPHSLPQADGSANPLMLNDVAEALGVPRRRLYDVINVFESIEVRVLFLS